MKEKISITINDKILRDVDSIVDNIVIRNRSQAIESLIEKALKENRIAVILAGEGRPEKGKNEHRYAFKINGMTIIEKIIRRLNDSGFKTIYIVADHEALTNIFKIVGDGSDYGVKIEFINEEFLQGSAAALKLLKKQVKTTFLVVFHDIVLDDIDLLELWKLHLNEKAIATMLIHSDIILTKYKERYGHVTMQGNKILNYVEKPKPSKLKSSLFFGAVFVAEPELLSYKGDSLEYEVFPELARRGFLGGLITNAEHLTIHSKEDLEYLKKKLR